MDLCRFRNAARALVLAALTIGAQTSTVSLPSYPLAVKSPYLSTWVPGDQMSDAATAQPEFWAGQYVTWNVVARVNSEVYALFGNPGNGTTAATTTGVSFTSSHTYVNLTAGSVSFTLDFFSPVFPGTSDYAQQSLPYSYLTVSATSSAAESVQILSAIDQTWTAQDGKAALNYTTYDSAGFFWFYNTDQIPYTEVSDQATYGSVLYGTTTGSAVTPACNAATTIYSQFASAGSLTATSTCSKADLAALSEDLGSITSGSVTFAVGFDRVDAIDYLGSAQTGYYRSEWPTVEEGIAYFLSNYDSALSSSLTFDAAVRSKSEAVSSAYGSQYADIIEASVRQTFGAIELTVPADDLTASPWVFLKEISSDGNVNTVDVIYQSWPIFISLNPNYIKFLFEPILAYVETGAWPEKYLVHDLGSDYPNATGHDNGVDESMPLFETSTLFILLYAYQTYTGDTSLAEEYTTLLEGYAQYLVDNSLYPASQLISVDAITAEANQTGLAIQSTIGINAASKVLGNTSLATIATDYATKIYEDGLGLNGDSPSTSTHFTYYYGSDTTWNVLFTAYSDVLLNLTTFPSAAWELQSSWYLTQIQELGLPFCGPVTDTAYDGAEVTWGLLDWNLVAAAASSAEVQLEVVNTTHAFLTDGKNTVPFGTKYYVEGADAGIWLANKARSTVGSNFAILALDQGTWGTSY